MERFFFDRKQYDTLYNCTALSQQEWDALVQPNIPIGLLYAVPGIIYFILYVPFLIVMARREFLKHSCYKLMFLLGIFDIFGVLFCGIVAGYMTIRGDIYCNSRNFNYIIGTFSTALWACTCMTCVILAINRVMDITMPHMAKVFFGGNRTFFWYAPPLIWGGYFLIFSYPHMYTAQYFAFFFDPYYGVDAPFIDHQDSSRPHYVHSVNNIGTLLSLTLVYSYICIFLIQKSKASGKFKISKSQRTLFLQCVMLCTIIVTTTSIYVLMQWIDVNIYIIILGQVTWQAGHGCPAVIYIIMNKSLKVALINLFLPKSKQKNGPTISVTKATSKHLKVSSSVRTQIV